MNTDPRILGTLLAEAGLNPSPEDVETLVALHARERRNVAEIRAVRLAWDGPEPETALRWLDLAAAEDSA